MKLKEVLISSIPSTILFVAMFGFSSMGAWFLDMHPAGVMCVVMAIVFGTKWIDSKG